MQTDTLEAPLDVALKAVRDFHRHPTHSLETLAHRHSKKDHLCNPSVLVPAPRSTEAGFKRPREAHMSFVDISIDEVLSGNPHTPEAHTQVMAATSLVKMQRVRHPVHGVGTITHTIPGSRTVRFDDGNVHVYRIHSLGKLKPISPDEAAAQIRSVGAILCARTAVEVARKCWKGRQAAQSARKVEEQSGGAKCHTDKVTDIIGKTVSHVNENINETVNETVHRFRATVNETVSCVNENVNETVHCVTGGVRCTEGIVNQNVNSVPRLSHSNLLRHAAKRASRIDLRRARYTQRTLQGTRYPSRFATVLTPDCRLVC